jgi:integrase
MPRGTKNGTIRKLTVTKLMHGRRREVTAYDAIKRYTDVDGHSREKKRRAYSYKNALELRDEITKEIADELLADLAKATAPQERTFADLAKYFQDNHLKPPVWVDGRRVEGMRSHEKGASTLKVLTEAFGDLPLRDIGYERLAEFRRRRQRQPVLFTRTDVVTVGGKKRKVKVQCSRNRSMASVHRPLEMAKRMFNIAVRLRWISESPFSRGDALIVKSHETKRMRILSRKEEANLLAACVKPRQHLRDAIVFALDTALRKNEQLTLTAGDVSLAEGVIRVRAQNAKIEEERIVPITSRLRPIVESLVRQSFGGRLFAYDSMKHSFATACRNAGVKDFRWHDLRHTATMCMLDAIKDPAKVMKITGHKQWSTFMIYVNVDEEIAREVAEAMDSARDRPGRSAGEIKSSARSIGAHL